MHYLVTGARGFVMSVLMKELLVDPDTTIAAVDLHAPDAALLNYLGDTGDRIHFAQCDVSDTKAISDLLATAAPDVVVHGATVTHDAVTEHRDPSRFISANVLGTTNVLDAARRSAQVRRVLFISSGAVYGCSPESKLTEESTPVPEEMYGISKLAGELIAQRFSQLYGLHVPIARLTKMFGPMERPTSGRAIMSLPYELARAAAHGVPARLTRRTINAGGDWLSAVDTAKALHLLAKTDGDGSSIYNISSGSRTPVSALVEFFGVDVIEEPADAREVTDMDPGAEFGKNGVYASTKAQDELGWKLTEISTQVAEYVRWAQDNPDFFPGSV
jgi:dTDP-glucose 4,6-dehydratase/UDP-glucose 4-epimerase/GDP-4-dehydro-6-deoxy-D-mannose reductase